MYNNITTVFIHVLHKYQIYNINIIEIYRNYTGH